MKCLIVDDEEPARARMRRLLAAHPDLEIAGEARDGLEALRKIEELRPDLLFLDIELPGLAGFEVLHSLPRDVTPLVIFVTGYDQHALAAFEANALAYLLKPVEPERLTQAVERARRLAAGSAEGVREGERLRRIADESARRLRHVVCRKRDRMLLIVPEQILWFQVEDGIVKGHTADDTFWVNSQLSELEAGLPPEMFFRARREVLVNVERIKEIRPYFKSGFLLIMGDAGATEIVVSERQARSFRLRIPGL
ncbi:MAG TPA: LytTR family DNA-binding domain-containing protein [Bryobacteraceae bacterium]|jgi:DNA-binding LytR/AlgR family response regulator|nr:LytTR family DNA-binding domain-containing protein [Bryobacteraceae bacterium]